MHWASPRPEQGQALASFSVGVVEFRRRKGVIQMTNKELAVQLYSTILQCAATVASSPNYRGTITIPSLDDAVGQVAQLTEKLSSIENK